MSNKKKLILVNGAQFGHSAGHYFYCKYLLESFDITYLCFDRGLKYLTLEGVEVYYVSFKGGKFSRILRFLRASIRQSFIISPHILIVTYFNLSFILGILCKSKKRVLDIRSGSLNENLLFRSIDNISIWFQSIFFNKVIILSESLRRRLKISKNKSSIVPLGSEIFFPGDHDFGSLRLLYVGTLNGRNITETIKGFNLFLQAKRSINISIDYTIVGFGSESETLNIKNCILEYKLSGFLKFEGRKNYTELTPYFERSNIGVVFVPQTPWYDCQPVTKLYEYVLSGMPVIATRTYENELALNQNIGVLISDSAEGFCNGLITIYNQISSFDSAEIRKTMMTNTWESIVNKNLGPFLLELLR